MMAIEKRTALRMPSRLHPAKLFGGDARFVGDCAIVDRSASGLRVGMFDPTIALPAEMAIFDETERERRSVRLVWQQGAIAGLRFEGQPVEVDHREAERLSGRYYALA